MTDCPLCGASFSAPSVGCPECGARVATAPPAPVSHSAPPARTYDPMTALVIVCAGIMLLLALVPPLTGRGMRVGREECRQNLKRIGAALHLYHDRYGTFPPACVSDDAGRPLYGWRVLILPFLGEDERELYERFDLDKGWSAPENRWVLQHMPDVFHCPSCQNTHSNYCTHYAGVTGPGTVFEGCRPVHSREVVDGLSRTLMVIESVNSEFPWTSPQDVDGSLGFRVNALHGASSRHMGGAHALTVDEGVHFLTDDLLPSDIRKMCIRDDGAGLECNTRETVASR